MLTVQKLVEHVKSENILVGYYLASDRDGSLVLVSQTNQIERIPEESGKARYLFCAKIFRADGQVSRIIVKEQFGENHTDYDTGLVADIADEIYEELYSAWILVIPPGEEREKRTSMVALYNTAMRWKSID